MTYQPPQKELDDLDVFRRAQGGIIERQVGGSHYQGFEIEPKDFIIQNNLDWCQGNVIKYICRHENKNGKEDLLKAIHVIEMLIEHKYGAE